MICSRTQSLCALISSILALSAADKLMASSNLICSSWQVLAGSVCVTYQVFASCLCLSSNIPSFCLSEDSRVGKGRHSSRVASVLTEELPAVDELPISICLDC